MSASAALAVSFSEWRDGSISADELVGRLHGGDESSVLKIIAPLPPHQRANLAVFCYHKAHLHRIGLAIAATCDQEALILALGTALGRTLFTQSRERRQEVDRTRAGQRPRITLAGAATRMPRMAAMQAEMTAL